MKSIMISSTVEDLDEYRTAAKSVCEEMGFKPTGMEDLTGLEELPKSASIDLVRQADLFLCIIAHRYGCIPQDEKKSIVELEYDEAVKCEKPRLIFMIDDSVAVKPANYDRGENYEKLSAFKKRLKEEKVIKRFLSTDDFSGQLRRALKKLQPVAPVRLAARDSLKVMSWNIGGAKLLEMGRQGMEAASEKLNTELECLLAVEKPDFVLLQEAVSCGSDSGTHAGILKPMQGYYQKYIEAINNQPPAHPQKWSRFYDAGWQKSDYLSQGFAILWRDDLHSGYIWNFETHLFRGELKYDAVKMETGLYTGDRDTEPRIAVVSHFIIGPSEYPLDLFVVNLHLTTLKQEREGKPRIDEAGAAIRMKQLDIVFHGIVSRYNEWRTNEDTAQDRQPPVWIIAGDLNCTPNSGEITRIKNLNFLDLNPEKAHGSKRSATGLNVDYIFVGPKYTSLDHRKVESEVARNRSPLKEIKCKENVMEFSISDHLPVVGTFPLKKDFKATQ